MVFSSHFPKTLTQLSCKAMCRSSWLYRADARGRRESLAGPAKYAMESRQLADRIFGFSRTNFQGSETPNHPYSKPGNSSLRLFALLQSQTFELDAKPNTTAD